MGKGINMRLNKIISKYGDNITGITDLTGGDEPSKLFYLLADKLSYLLDEDTDKVISERGVLVRRRLHFILATFGKFFLTNPQIYENRNFLRNPNQENVEKDSGIVLPDEPVIWTSNHAFKDDTLATILAAQRHAYILFGSIPQFYNTLDGVTSWINGVVMTNRKVSISKKTSVGKAVKAMQYGADLMLFPEGVWNKSPNALLLDLWPGIYRIASETGARIVPVVHYIRDCTNQLKDNPIHTVVDDPVRIDDLSEKAALDYIRDILATWYYLMMDIYGKSTRDAELRGAESPCEAWEKHLQDRVRTAARYDLEIELCADYRPKGKVTSDRVWRDVAAINKITPDNAATVAYAYNEMQQFMENDFQRRF
jgi:1-acyl-sn-glycerol-3-phosphate acyltransferase